MYGTVCPTMKWMSSLHVAVLSQLKIATVIVCVQIRTTDLKANNALLGCLLHFCCCVVAGGH